MTINTHDLLVDFGKHKGERYTRVPVSYLRWMVNASHREANTAAAELERRGIPLHDRVVDVSGHAIDSASLRAHSVWKKTRTDCNEGLHAWLARICEEALNAHEMDSQHRIHYAGLRLIFEPGAIYPTLKTVIRHNRNSKTPHKMRHLQTVDQEKQP